MKWVFARTKQRIATGLTYTGTAGGRRGQSWSPFQVGESSRAPGPDLWEDPVVIFDPRKKAEIRRFRNDGLFVVCYRARRDAGFRLPKRETDHLRFDYYRLPS